MRLCYLCSPKSHYVKNWIGYFSSHGWDVHLITRDPLDPDEVPTNVTQHRLPTYGPKYGFILQLLKVNRILSRISPDVIHIHSTPSYGQYALAITRRPFILNEWGPSHIWESKGVRRALEKYAYKRAKTVLTEVEETKTLLAKEYNLDREKIETFLWGVNRRIFRKGYAHETAELRARLNIKPDDFVILYSRSVSPFYGFEDTLLTIKRVKAYFPNIKLIFFRFGYTEEYGRKISALIDKLGLRNNVIAEEAVDNKIMPIYYNASDVSINLPEEDNGSPVIAEAMSCGCIVLGTNCRGYKGRITDGKNGFLVEDRSDVENLSEIIRYCIENPDVKERFYQMNKDYIDEHEDWDKQMSKMEKMYMRFME